MVAAKDKAEVAEEDLAETNNRMKIAVAIVKPEKTSSLSDVFGRSNFFFLFNNSDNSEMILPNPFAKELGGAGIQSARFLIENEVDVVIVKKIGMNPFRFLTSANIKVYQCKEATADEAIRFFSEGKLLQIENVMEDSSFSRKRNRCGKRF
jgi:predicted Fe-Mo cluster-binding NifX family protein